MGCGSQTKGNTPVASKVYYAQTAQNESPASVCAKLDRLLKKSAILDKISKDEFAGIKLHFGEEGNTGHISPELVRHVVNAVAGRTKRAFLTDSNVLYKQSRRTNSVDHLNLAHEHGFNITGMGVPVMIADGLLGRNFVEVPIKKKHFSSVKIAYEISQCDRLVVLTHITGHILTGFAGAIKNLGMGCASRRGKYEQHAGIVPEVKAEFCVGCGLCAEHCPADAITLKEAKAEIAKDRCIGCGECIIVCRTEAIETAWSERLEKLQEKMVEYAYGAVSAVKKPPIYLNFLIKVTGNCDCLAQDEKAIVHDAGILASDDPVSIDKASADILSDIGKLDIFKAQRPDIDWTAQLRYAQDIGLGTMDYTLEKI